MLIHAVASGTPAWLAAALVGITTLGAIASSVANMVGAWLQVRRLEMMDKQRQEADQARHQEVLRAIAELPGRQSDHLGG